MDNNPTRRLPAGIQEPITELIKNWFIVSRFFSLKEISDKFDFNKRPAAYPAKKVWKEAISNMNFGCIIISDEAHLICSQGEYSIRYAAIET